MRPPRVESLTDCILRMALNGRHDKLTVANMVSLAEQEVNEQTEAINVYRDDCMAMINNAHERELRGLVYFLLTTRAGVSDLALESHGFIKPQSSQD